MVMGKAKRLCVLFVSLADIHFDRNHRNLNRVNFSKEKLFIVINESQMFMFTRARQ